MKRLTKVALAVSMGTLALTGCKKDPATDGSSATAPKGSQSDNTAEKKAQSGAGSAAKSDEKAPEGCNSDFAQKITVDYTLTKACSPYTLPDGKVIMVDGWYLTIEPGVEVRFGEGAGIEVGYNSKGRLTAKGTKEEPIKFTSAKRQEPGYWKGLSIRANAAGSVIEHASIEYAGQQNGMALRALGADMVIRNVKFVGIAGHAVEAEDNLKEFSANDLKDSGVSGIAVEVKTESLAAFKPDNVFPENTVIAFSGKVDRSITIGPGGAPYRLTETQLAVEGKEGQTATVTIQAGTTIQNAADARWDIGYNEPGGFVVKGTKEQPVVFTSAEENPLNGSWQGFKIRGHAKVVNIDHARIEWAGEKDGASLQYASPASLGKVTNTTFTHSAGAAVKADESPQRPFEAFSGNTFEDIEGPILDLDVANAHKLSADQTFPKDGHIRLSGSALRTDTLLTAQPIPYRFDESLTVESNDANKSATLTIEPGTRVEVSPEVVLTFGYNHPGRLIAKGTPENQIVFTAATEPWGGIRLKGHAKVDVDNAVFESVGEGHVGIDAEQTSQGSIQNVTFKKMPVGMKLCPKIKTAGLKGEEVPKVEDSEC